MAVVIGMDVATKTGIAVGEPSAVPISWTEILGEVGSDHDSRFAQAIVVTANLINKYEPALIAIESPILVPRRDNLKTLMLLYGLVANIRGIARNRKIPTIMVTISEIDKHFLGVGKMKSAERKRAIMARCHQLGWKPDGQDSADAISVWDYGCSRLSRSHSISTTPLFEGK